MSTIRDNYESAADCLRQAEILISEAAMFILAAEDEGGTIELDFDLGDIETSLEQARHDLCWIEDGDEEE